MVTKHEISIMVAISILFHSSNVLSLSKISKQHEFCVLYSLFFSLHKNLLFLFRSKSDMTISFVIQNELISIHRTRDLEENITRNVVIRTNRRMSFFPSFFRLFHAGFFFVAHLNVASCLTLNFIRPTIEQNEKLKLFCSQAKCLPIG